MYSYVFFHVNYNFYVRMPENLIFYAYELLNDYFDMTIPQIYMMSH
jgi:hypothetical protein